MKPRRILSLMVALAVLLMPAGMIGGGPAMAMSHDAATATTQHCADQPQPSKEQPPKDCCIVACAAYLADLSMLAAASASSLSPQPVVPADPHGLPPEAATPPPRSS